MFFRPGVDPDAPRPEFLNAVVTPRPIAWISTRGSDGGENLAPYSFFNAVAYTPPQVMFASVSTKPDRDDTKDTAANIGETNVFCVNLVGRADAAAMNATSGPWPRETDEFALAGVSRAPCAVIACSRVEGAPASLECRSTQIVRLPGQANLAVFGEVVGVWLRDDCLRAGRFDPVAAGLIARLGGRNYAALGEIFAMDRPG